MMINDDPKQQLLQLILDQGILHTSEARPLIARDGKTRLQWVMNFLGISLNHDALQLAAQETLKLLAHFRGRQLATIGTAAVPLLSACILESKGKYSGLMVRSQRKAYGTASLIDGRINKNESIIIVDDSIGSGTNMLDCIAKLEAEGLHVEGCVCLVRFGYDSGYVALTERGYRVMALFDQGHDISPHYPNDRCTAPYPIMDSFQHIVWDEETLPDYLSPFQAIRRSMTHFWRCGRLLKPPGIFNQPLDTRGGLWISLRAQDHVYTSQGRHGFWQLPGDESINTPLAVSYVSWLLANHIKADPRSQQQLDNGALGLSLFGPLEACDPGAFDHRYHGLMIRSKEAPWKMGGALPNMPGFHNNAQLLQHARFHNTGLRRYEPYELYKHSVRKLLEPGTEWPYGGAPASGQPWDEQQTIIQPIVSALYGWVKQVQRGEALSDPTTSLFIPAQCKWLFLSVYSEGKQLACVGSTPHNAADLVALVEAAAQDQRWRTPDHQLTGLYLRVSLLSQSQYLGHDTNLQSFSQFATGHDAVSIQHDQQFAIILPEIPAQYHWTAQQLGDALRQKAGIAQADQPAHWHRFRCRSWQMHTPEQCYLLNPGQPLAQPGHPTEATALSSYLSFLNHHRQHNGLINSHYYPGMHQATQNDGLFHTAYVLWRLADIKTSMANWQASYQLLTDTLSGRQTEQDPLSSMERAYSVLALLANPAFHGQHRPLIAEQLSRIQQAFNHHGQLNRPTEVLETDYYSTELQVLLTARQQGFFIDEFLLDKAVLRLLDYGEYQATPRQYPALIKTLTLIKAIFANKPEYAGQAGALTNHLSSELKRWQQSSGAFLTEHTHLAPALFTVRALSSLFISEQSTPDVPAYLSAGLDYLRQQTLFPEQGYSTPGQIYSIGGIYSGLTHSSMDIIASAEILWLKHQLADNKEAKQ